METFFQDVKFALRNLSRTPAFPLAAIATLALGIGATTAIFSTVNAATLKPLPYPNPDNLYSLRTTLTDGRVTTGLVSGSELFRLNAPSLPIEHAAGVLSQDLNFLRNDGVPVHKTAYIATDGFFELFGLPMTLGASKSTQPLGPNGQPNGPPTVILSYRMWHDLFSADPAIVGKPIHFAEFNSTVAGVASKDFDTPHDADLWLTVLPSATDIGHVYDAYLRLKPGVNITRARSEMDAVMTTLQHDFPAADRNRAWVVRPLVEQIVGDLGPILIVVLSATALLLILACVNVTNLLLARGAARAREMAVRVALGAGRGRIVRQLLTESVLLATAGAIVGVLGAYAGLRALLSIGASKLPRMDAVTFDSHVFLFALGALIVSGILVGFAPALRLAATDVKTLMNESGRATSGGKGTARWLSALTVAEIALAVTLVAGAGWLVRSFQHLWATDPGFVADGRLMFDVSLQGPKFQNQPAVIAATNDLLTRLRAISGVADVGLTSNFPLRGSIENSLLVQFHGEPFDSVNPPGTRQRIASPGFFKAMGIRLLSGRDFTDDDKQGTTPVAIVNRTFMKRNLGGKDPIDVRFSAGYPAPNPQNEVTIIGVVEDVRQRQISEAAQPAYYTPTGQAGLRRMTIVVHSQTADPTPLEGAIRNELQKTDPQMAVDFDTVTNLVGSTLQRQQLGMTLMMLFGLAAVALAAIGIYGVIAYAAAQQRNEVATRLALGATPGTVFMLVLKQGRTLTLIGAAIGIGAAYLAGQYVSSKLYALPTSEHSILAAATLVVVTIAIVATMIPAFRASRLDPSRVLRTD
jgi:predicted permease